MKIEFNKVTWYSKSLALIVVFIILPAVAFRIGRQYEAVSSLQSSTPDVTFSEPMNLDEQEVDYSRMNCGDLIYQQDMNQCSAVQRHDAEKRMNEIYEKLIASKFETLGITTSQDKWQAYAKYECDLQGSLVEGGTLEPLIVNECRTRITEDRIFQLKAWLDMVSLYVPVE
jgi:uncharacterized protein YecT (DUF1311 family)